jgi:copper chaperone
MWERPPVSQSPARPGAARPGFAALARIARHSVHPPLQENKMPEFLVEGMSCAHCVNLVTEAIHRLDPVALVNVDLGSKHVRVHSDVDRFLLSQALVDAGYDPIPVGLESTDNT